MMTDDWPASPLPGFEFGDYELVMLRDASACFCIVFELLCCFRDVLLSSICCVVFQLFSCCFPVVVVFSSSCCGVFQVLCCATVIDLVGVCCVIDVALAG